MSIVLSAVYPGWALMVADRRGTRGRGDHFCVVTENLQKIFSLSRYAAVGFTGNFQYISDVKSGIEQEKLIYADEFARCLQQKAIKLRPKYRNYDVPGIQFVVTGVKSVGGMANYVYYGFDDCSLVEQAPTPDSPFHLCSLCNISSDRLVQQLDRLSKSGAKLTLQGIYAQMLDHVRFVAGQTPEVNDRTNHILITEFDQPQ